MGTGPTLMDVSRLCGLSIYTVSRSLNGRQGVSDEARLRVAAAASELGYVANAAAQQLRRNTRNSVAVVTAGTSNNAYYLDLMRGIQRTVDRSGRRVIMADVAAEGAYNRSAEDAAVRNLIQIRAAGVISTLTLSKANLKLLHEWEIPVVFVDSKPPAGSPCPGIFTDNIGAAKAVGRHLAGHGYTSWLLLIYPPVWSSRYDRELGIRQAAEDAGASLTVIESPNNSADARRTLDDYYASTNPQIPRAIIAGNNPLALGAMQFLKGRNLNVPAEVAIVAFDEFDWAPMIDPALTVVNEGSEEIGVIATNVLSRIIDQQTASDAKGESTRPQYRNEDNHEVTADLVVRRSCGCVEAPQGA